MNDKITTKRVGVLMGGPSCERDISIRSGTAVTRALKNKGIDAVSIELASSSTMNGYKEMVQQKIQSSSPDIVFVALHGEFGEEGGILEILEDLKIPYTGSRVNASSLGMDKIKSKEIFGTQNIPIPRYIVINKQDLDSSSSPEPYFKELGNRLVIKPSDEGSSIGLSIVDSKKDFYEALNNAFRYSDSVIVEEYIQGREITVGILDGKALPIVEVLPKKRFFDFEAKYKKGLTEYNVPAEIGTDAYDASQKIALMAHNALGARVFSRVDMILSEKGLPFVLEVNTIPGLTEMSLLPKAAAACGINFEELILKILEAALW